MKRIYYKGDEIVIGSMVYYDEELTEKVLDGELVLENEKIITVEKGEVIQIEFTQKVILKKL